MAAEISRLVFLRITLVGKSGCGKTALLNAFVNGALPGRYTRTDSAAVYYKKLEIEDEGEYDGSKKPILLEIEDTPGSERGANEDEDDEDTRQEDAGEPTIKVGSRVLVLMDKARVQQAFKRSKHLMYKTSMDGMLGREYQVKAKNRDGTFGLPAPDGTVWSFPHDAIELKVAMDLPIDTFLEEGRHEFSRDDIKNNAEAIQRPFSAYDRPIKAPHEDRTLAKCRMGFMICFDIADPTSESLKEAMNVHTFLMKKLENPRFAARLRPMVFLVGCQNDKTAPENRIDLNRKSAKVFSERMEIKFMETSARTNFNVEETFFEMIQVILSKEGLWSLQGPDDDEEEEPEEATCALQ